MVQQNPAQSEQLAADPSAPGTTDGRETVTR
jgi:hypothetical protein